MTRSSAIRPRVVAAVVASALAVTTLATPWSSGKARALELSTTVPTGLSQLLASTSTSTTIRGIAEFDTVPTATQVASLEGLGLVVQPMHHVPLALVFGPLTAMQAAVASGTAQDVYPDDPIQLLDTSSSDAMGAGSLRAAGLTGKGVTVAVVDSGCDASHPRTPRVTMLKRAGMVIRRWTPRASRSGSRSP